MDSLPLLLRVSGHVTSSPKILYAYEGETGTGPCPRRACSRTGAEAFRFGWTLSRANPSSE